MSLMYTPEAQIGDPCPSFECNSLDDQQYNLESFKDKNALVFLFICNHCPYVKAIESRIISLANEFKNSKAQLIAICSNDPTEYEEDSFENLKKNWLEKKFNIPYLFDDTQKIAKDFGAICTPDIFVYNFQNKPAGELAYRGRLDDSWKDESAVNKQDLKEAITLLLEKNEITEEQIPSMGCSIKWIEESNA